MRKQIFMSLQGMLTEMSKMILLMVFLYSGTVKRFTEASGIPVFITDKGLNFTTEAFKRRAEADLNFMSYSAAPFIHDSRGLKAKVDKLELHQVVFPEGIHTGITPTKGFKVGARNISFTVDFTWKNTTLHGVKFEDGNVSARATEVDVNLTVEITNNLRKSSLVITDCEAIVGRFRPKSGDSDSFRLAKRQLINDLQEAICRKATEFVSDQAAKLEKQIFNSSVFQSYTLSKFSYKPGYIQGILEGKFLKGGDDEYPELNVPTNFMMGGVLTEKSFNMALHAAFKRDKYDLLYDVTFWDDLTDKFGLSMTLSDRPRLNVFMTNAPVAKITPQGITVTSVGRVMLVPCASTIKSNNWLNSTLSLSFNPSLALAKDRRRLLVKLRNFRIRSGLFQSGPETDSVDRFVARIMNMLGDIGFPLDLPLPEGISITEAVMVYSDGQAELFVDMSG